MENVIGRNLERLRKANHFTQSQVSDYLRVRRSAYANYEAGLREPPLDVLERLAALYGCELSIIFESDIDIIDNMLVTAFRIGNLTPSDLEEVGAFKRVVANYLKMERLLAV